MGLVVGAWRLLSPKPAATPTATVVPKAPEADRPSPTTAGTGPAKHVLPARLDRRWLPDRTALIFTLRLSRLRGSGRPNRAIDEIAPAWRQSVGPLLQSLGLASENVERMTWASTDLDIWPQRSVVVLELEPGHQTADLRTAGEAVDLGLPRFVCRRLPAAAWSAPFVIVDGQTIVSGDETSLRQLGPRTESHLESLPLDRLLKALGADADATLLVDLAAARAAHWQLPIALADVWPAGKRAWHTLWEIPEGLGCAVRWSQAQRSELALACEGETAADKVRAAVEELLPAVKAALPQQLETLKANFQAGQITAATAEQYKLLLDEGLAAMATARCDVADATVRVRISWNHSPLDVAAAGMDSQAAIRADWRTAALSVDQANHQRLLAGLGSRQKAEGRFPVAVAGGALLPPETRLSWIAEMLPYYDHADWHRQLETGYSWNGPQNRPVTRRALPEVVNPVLGPQATEAGFPVTHYVGVAGVGPDAARLAAEEPRAGVFGYDRGIRPEEIRRGAANAIAILGVSERCGPWAAGGDATVRALTQPPYVNGPDGFGSGQADGMLAGMADGSVRFISKNIDPHVIEQLATINSPADVTAAVLDPKPAGKPDVAVAKAAAPEALPGPGAEHGKPAPVPPVAAKIAARLNTPIPGLSFTATPLVDAVAPLAILGNVPITFDPDALQELGVSLRDPITMNLSAKTVGKSLEAILAGRKLAYVMDSGHILVTSPAEHRELPKQLRYTVADLTGGDAQRLAELAALVQRLVAPDCWQSNGGRGAIRCEGGALLILQTGNVHYQIIAFCEKLRVARGLPTRSRLNPELFAVSTRWDRARPLLGQAVTVNYPQATRLTEILASLKKATGAELLVDWTALAADGMDDSTTGTLKTQKQLLASALSSLLAPLGLAYRMVDAATIQVTTRKALDSRLELEFYAVGGQLKKGSDAAALIERIKGRLAAASWSDAGGSGVLWFDPPSRCLVVLQSQPVQTALEALLAEKP
jgi:hypothetical protein